MEDLIDNTRNKLKEICEFSEIHWNDKMMEIPLQREQAHIGRYKMDLSKKEQQNIHEILAKPIRVLGYDNV